MSLTSVLECLKSLHFISAIEQVEASLLATQRPPARAEMIPPHPIEPMRPGAKMNMENFAESAAASNVL